ncbi:thioredoxin-related transmembrane protein 1 [Neocloeon triangulifer]|uniref:thioredoxin-related transmembrane protein 1 n=1 Tax=Neocloeon triangulifer TaxID=2078957 RepID=UPI00286F11BF|nr:thioredoxin-related transmembrane protein 1 [Neocloeon triangulifer]
MVFHMDGMSRLKWLLILAFLCVSVSSKKQPSIVQLSEENWEQMLEGDWMIEFFAPWCPACKNLGPIWEEFSKWQEDLDIKVGHIDVTVDVGLSGRFMVTALPTIFHVHNGEFRQYRGARKVEDFVTFIEDSKWQEIEPIPSWKSPSSLQMSVVAYFYKLSMVLRTVHNHLMETYGLPIWGSYLIFALFTILVGALLGLLLVCVIDCIYPPKPSSRAADSKGESEPEEDDDDDCIKDDRVGGGSASEGEEDQDEEELDASEDEGEGSQASEPSSAQASPNVRRRKPPRAD